MVPLRGQVEEYASSWVLSDYAMSGTDVVSGATSEEYWMGKNTKERKAHALMDYGVPGTLPTRMLRDVRYSQDVRFYYY
eukprot:3937208-Rhodomonas_salina.9